jgi:hypothetical protein
MMIDYGQTSRTSRDLPSGVLIGGVANFFTSTKPIARVDGTALVVGDLWYNPSTGVQGFWNGTYWLTTYTIDGSVTGSAANVTALTTTVSAFAPIKTANSFLEKILIQYRRTTGILDASNRYDLTFAETRNDGVNGTTIPGSFSINSDGDPSTIQADIPTNILISTTDSPVVGINIRITAVGTPGNIRLAPIPVFRYVV